MDNVPDPHIFLHNSSENFLYYHSLVGQMATDSCNAERATPNTDRGLVVEEPLVSAVGG